MIHDSKKRAISIDFNASNGEFSSYTFHPDLTTATGQSFTDKNLTGVMEKFEPQVKKKLTFNQEEAAAYKPPLFSRPVRQKE